MPSFKFSIPQFLIGILIVALFLWLVIAPENFKFSTGQAFKWSATTFGGFWQILVLSLFLSSLVVALSPLGRIKLGAEPPELSYGSWLAIILSTLLAGGGVFWSAAEPLYHFQSVPLPFKQSGVSAPAAAMAQSYFHWGFLAWTALGTLAIIPLQAMVHDPKLRNRPCLMLYPIIPRRVLKGPFGHVIDIIAVISVLIGTIGPIGFLGIQLSYILSSSTPLPDSVFTQLLLIGLLASVYTISAVKGIQKGIRVLSLFNMALCVGFGLFLLASIPIFKILDLTVQSGGTYFSHFFDLALVDTKATWTNNWTHFFWGWFLGYGPIMSIFLFRISKGRTIRELFLTICLMAPLVTNLWFSIVGGSGILLDQSSEGAITQQLQSNGMPAALIAIINLSDVSTLLLLLVVPLIFFFMATTGDSVALSISTIFSKDQQPAKQQKIFWSLSMAITAAAILVIGKGEAITLFQQTIVIASVPVSIIMLIASIAGIVLLVRSKSNTLE